MIKRIDNVGIAVSNLARSIAFYERIGFAQGDMYDEEGLHGCLMSAQAAVLFLFQSQHAEGEPVIRDLALQDNPPGHDHVSFFVENVDQAYSDLAAQGIVFEGQPADQWGMRIVDLKDPDGNNLYLLHYSD